MLTLFDSNRYEILSEALLDALAESVAEGNPWCMEAIIVPNAAVQRRLELEIAARFGICAHLQFSYLAQWLWTHIGKVMDISVSSAFMPERLAWRCYRLLEPQAWTHIPQRLSALREADDAMRYALAQRIALLFDRYLTYRPDWLEAWQCGRLILTSAHTDAVQRDDERWQAQLWRQLCAECPVKGGALPGLYPFLARAATLDAHTLMRAQWPKRLYIFTLSAIAPLHLALLREFTRWIDIRMYTLNPCRQYWGDWMSAAQRADLALRDQAEYVEVGNMLLTEWGQQIQMHLQQLQTLTDTVETLECPLHAKNPAPTWLAALQNAWLDGQAWPEPPTADAPAHVEVHICHSLTRQLEVLHDTLLALFNADEADTAPLLPSEVLVTVPDLVTAVPLIEAIFGAASGARRIPYRITGLPTVRTHPAARVLCDLLRLPERCTQWIDWIEWLRNDDIAARYGLEPRALDTIEQWCITAGALRSRAPDTATDRCIGSDALARLYLGYVLPNGADPIAGVLPISAVADLETLEWLGRFTRFIHDLNDFMRVCRQPATAAEWQLRLADALERFFPVHAQEAERIIEVRSALNRVFEAMQEGLADTLLPAAVIHRVLTSTFEAPTHGGVPTGSVTFCTPASLRGLPYRVVCTLGMDEGVLPSCTRADEFDLMTADARAGDRQRRPEERNVFLDLILSARERLWIAYTGRDVRDNTPLPPAAVVDELLDHLGAALARVNGQTSSAAIAKARQRFIVEHPLHPFSAEYFSNATPLFLRAEAGAGARAASSACLPNEQKKCAAAHPSNPVRTYWTYDPERAEIAAALHARPAHAAARAWMRHPLPPLEHGHDPAIEFNAFESFWRHPIRALLRDRLGVQLAAKPSIRPEFEPFTLDHARRRVLAYRVLPILLAAGASEVALPFNACVERVRRIMHASPELPEGAFGAAMCVSELEALRQWAVRICRESTQPPVPRLFTLELTPAWPDAPVCPEHEPAHFHRPVRLEGVLHIAGQDSLVLYHYRSPRACDYLSAWLGHLVMCADTSEDHAPRTLWQGHPEAFAFKPVPRAVARRCLAELISLYLYGQCALLRFFPDSAWAWVKHGEAAARRAWTGEARQRGEMHNAWLRIALRGEALEAALDPHFRALAHTIFAPLRTYLEVGTA